MNIEMKFIMLKCALIIKKRTFKVYLNFTYFMFWTSTLMTELTYMTWLRRYSIGKQVVCTETLTDYDVSSMHSDNPF
jgi:hypothetical protein